MAYGSYSQVLGSVPRILIATLSVSYMKQQKEKIMKTVKKDTCPGLSGTNTITYEVGIDE